MGLMPNSEFTAITSSTAFTNLRSISSYWGGFSFIYIYLFINTLFTLLFLKQHYFRLLC
ncbi:hypothetical protein JCM19296_1270 [Nonlabens ulvanivorans]|uniref:Uncharacterized protein n=1 Tax=Nonlabens ulvanivorans TaxID=906888 RepID=A0A081D9T2_NONUL|nr:hypothetical protein JCM19296_1270 [Nonlabens ulvanivorans]